MSNSFDVINKRRRGVVYGNIRRIGIMVLQPVLGAVFFHNYQTGNTMGQFFAVLSMFLSFFLIGEYLVKPVPPEV